VLIVFNHPTVDNHFLWKKVSKTQTGACLLIANWENLSKRVSLGSNPRNHPEIHLKSFGDKQETDLAFYNVVLHAPNTKQYYQSVT
jgi:hypothetical protein